MGDANRDTEFGGSSTCVLTQEVWGGTQELAFLTQSPETLTLPVQGPYCQNGLWRAGAGRPRRRSLAPSRRRAPRHPPRSSVTWRISSVCEETLGTFPTSPPGGTKLSSWPHSAPEAAENQGRGGPWGPMAWVRMQALPVATSDSGKADPPPGDSASPSIKWGH